MSSFIRQILLNATTRILTLIFLSLGLLCLFFIFFGYYSQRSITQEDELGKLQSIAKTASLLIDGEVVANLAEKFPNIDDIKSSDQDSAYFEVHKLLKEVKKINKLETDIYLLFVENDELLFSVTAGTKPYYRHQYENSPPELSSLWAIGGTLKPYEDENGHWLSAFAPIKNKQGAVSAIIMVDSKFDAYIEKNNQRFFFYMLITIAGLVIIGVILYYQTKKILVKEEKLKADLEENKNLLEVAHQESISSLFYAKRIQKNLFPNPKSIQKRLGECFVINKPLEVVGGDFYWISEYKNQVILVLGDCTGHGVPGAFMSLIGNNLLNQIVKAEAVDCPSKILRTLNERLNNTLNDADISLEIADGMDVAIVKVDKNTNEVFYSGAYQNMLYTSENKTSIIPGDRRGLSANHCHEEDFTVHQFKYKKGDRFYIFSDGIVDQFGGPKVKKFKKKQLFELIENTSHQQIKAQGSIIQKRIEEWKGDTPQIDDILMIGVEL